MSPRALTLTLLSLPLLAQPLPPVEAQHAPSLRLETRLTGQTYCRAPNSNDTYVILHLQLKFTAIGDEPVILYRMCDQLLRKSLSSTLADANAGKYVQDWHISYAPFFYLKLIRGSEAFPPQDYFVVLRPNESYFLNASVSLSYCTPARPTCPSLSGEHYLRARYGTWRETEEVLARARQTWKPFGYLWGKDLTTEPIAFTVDEPSTIPQCEVPQASAQILR